MSNRLELLLKCKARLSLKVLSETELSESISVNSRVPSALAFHFRPNNLYLQGRLILLTCTSQLTSFPMLHSISLRVTCIGCQQVGMALTGYQYLLHINNYVLH